MSRYIDAEKFVVELRERFCEDCDDELACWACGIHKTIEAIEDYPAADAVPIALDRRMRIKYTCSKCHISVVYTKPSEVHCPNCNAKMNQERRWES